VLKSDGNFWAERHHGDTPAQGQTWVEKFFDEKKPASF
jgi:hypothetical protein